MTAKLRLSGSKDNKYSLVDERFYGQLNKYSWHLNTKGYVTTNYACEHMAYNKNKHGNVRLHQMVKTLSHDLADVCMCDTSYQLAVPILDIHHINADKLDNRLTNLEYMTSSLNSSKKGLRTGLSSKYNGVIWYTNTQKWLAQCSLNGKTRHIGYFNTEVEAAKAFDATCKRLSLDRMLNFPSDHFF